MFADPASSLLLPLQTQLHQGRPKKNQALRHERSSKLPAITSATPNYNVADDASNLSSKYSEWFRC
eukprot:2609485-Amphidinium_carterae.1